VTDNIAHIHLGGPYTAIRIHAGKLGTYNLDLTPHSRAGHDNTFWFAASPAEPPATVTGGDILATGGPDEPVAHIYLSDGRRLHIDLTRIDDHLRHIHDGTNASRGIYPDEPVTLTAVWDTP
jgi:hypothetical protein